MSHRTLAPAPPALWAALLTLVLVLPAADASAQTFEETARKTAEASISEGDFQHVLVAEALPGPSSWLADVAVELEGTAVRYPLKFERSEAGSNRKWTPTWQPKAAYSIALREIVTDAALPAVASSTLTDGADWSKLPNLPGLPVVVTRDKMTTPFGQMRLGPGAKPLEELRGHVNSWIRQVLAGDAGPATVDLLAARDASWRHVTAVLYAAAGAGLFNIHLVTRRRTDQGDSTDRPLAVVPGTAPVFESGHKPDRDSALVVGMVPTETDRWAFRISVAGRQITGSKSTGGDNAPCVEGVAFCLDDPSKFSQTLRTTFKNAFQNGPPKVSHVMFAATGDLEVGDVLPYLARVPGALGIRPPDLYLGYIGEAEDLTTERSTP